jgi:hypothetical protein
MEQAVPSTAEDFKIPPELARRPPRTVRRRTGTSGCVVIFGRLFILPHMIIGLVLLLAVPATIGAVFFGNVHQGHVVRTWTGRGSKGRTKYNLRYSYEAGGKQRTGERTISQRQYGKLNGSQKGGLISPIQVWTLNLGGYYFDQVVLSDESPWESVGLAFLFALFWNGVLSIFVYMFWITPWQSRRLYQWGIPVPGRISGKHISHGKTTSYYLDYEFIHPQLGILRKQQSVNSKGYYHAHNGQMVTILCYPRKKRPTVVYEYGDFECV